MNIELRPVTADDYAAILALNEASVPHVTSIPLEALAHLHAESCYCKVAWIGEEIVGFLVVLDEDAAYDSPNFQYFKQRYPHFAYVDRIFVSEAHRGLGLGARLYEDLVAELDGGKPVVTCEVNLDPPNPGSLAFHAHLGFVQVDEQHTEGGTKRVSLMVWDLADGPVPGLGELRPTGAGPQRPEVA
jgi:predicted GNAT superfamily acetyltransferase